jgi:hypothetical protein
MNLPSNKQGVYTMMNEQGLLDWIENCINNFSSSLAYPTHRRKSSVIFTMAPVNNGKKIKPVPILHAEVNLIDSHKEKSQV